MAIPPLGVYGRNGKAKSSQRSARWTVLVSADLFGDGLRCWTVRARIILYGRNCGDVYYDKSSFVKDQLDARTFPTAYCMPIGGVETDHTQLSQVQPHSLSFI